MDDEMRAAFGRLAAELGKARNDVLARLDQLHDAMVSGHAELHDEIVACVQLQNDLASRMDRLRDDMTDPAT